MAVVGMQLYLCLYLLEYILKAHRNMSALDFEYSFYHLHSDCVSAGLTALSLHISVNLLNHSLYRCVIKFFKVWGSSYLAASVVRDVVEIPQPSSPARRKNWIYTVSHMSHVDVNSEACKSSFPAK
jgi:hypothetical protein